MQRQIENFLKSMVSCAPFIIMPHSFIIFQRNNSDYLSRVVLYKHYCVNIIQRYISVSTDIRAIISSHNCMINATRSCTTYTYSVCCTLFTPHTITMYTLHSIQCTHYTAYNVNTTQHTMYTLHSIQCTHYTAYNVHTTQHTMFSYTLHNIKM